MARPEPEHIFTPKQIASREMFAKRNESDLRGNPGLQDNLGDALRDRGGQVLIYGDTGVGKSSLLKYAAENERKGTVLVECMQSKSYTDLLEDALRTLVDVRELSRSTSKTTGTEAEATGSVPFLVSLKGKIKGDYGRNRTFEVVQKPPLDALINAMQESNRSLLVLDNFQNIDSQDTRLLVAQMMEALSDRSVSTGDIKCVVIGIAEDSPSLLGGSGSYRRRTTEVGVPRMPDDEIEEILSRGFQFLRLSIPKSLMNELVFFSDGFPFFAHLLGLNIARHARRVPSAIIDKSMIDQALIRVARDVDQSYEARLRNAFELKGEVQPRRQILRILSRSDRRQWRSSDVVAAYSEEYQREPGAFLHVALGQLIDPARGSILKRQGRQGDYIYQFTDPQMRPYLRITTFRSD